MNKTLYIKDSDGPIWDRARELATINGMGLSQLIIGLIKRYVALHKACPGCNTPVTGDWKHCPDCGRAL
jgi:rRNA maturation endonuclease Nob1